MFSGVTHRANGAPPLTTVECWRHPSIMADGSLISKRSARKRGDNTLTLNLALGIPQGFLLCPICEQTKPDSEYYKTRGRPCGYCRACHALKAKAWKQANRDIERAIDRRSRERNLEKRYARTRRWHAKNKDRVAARRKLWAAENKDVIFANNAKRRALELWALPVWVDQQEVRKIYRAAALMSAVTGVKYHVDHIVPLKSPHVCGLHWEGNLQVIPAIDNMKKHNRLVHG
jgi:hypothetical protein